MQVKKVILGSVAAGGIGLASLGVGAGVASAAPQHQSVATHQQAPAAQPAPVQRPDHKPFNYRGHRVTPTFDQHRHGWGFWFLGVWIPIR